MVVMVDMDIMETVIPGTVIVDTVSMEPVIVDTVIMETVIMVTVTAIMDMVIMGMGGLMGITIIIIRTHPIRIIIPRIIHPGTNRYGY